MKAFLTCVVSLALLVAMWFVLKPAPEGSVYPSSNSSVESQAAQEQGVTAVQPLPEQPAADSLGDDVEPATPAVVEANIEIKQGRLAAGPEAVRVVQGQTVKLTVVSDRRDELHLHGYDLTLQLQPAVAATLTVLADKTGRFEYEIHSSHSGVGTLEVYPAP